MSTTGRNLAFAAVLEKIAAGRSNRELARLTKEAGQAVSHATIADARWGTVPKYPVVERLLTGLGVEEPLRSEAFQAGFPVLEAADDARREELDAHRLLNEGMRRIQSEYRRFYIPLPELPADQPLTREWVRTTLAEIRNRAQRGGYESRAGAILDQVAFGRHESPRQRYERRRAALEARYGEQGYQLPQHTAHASGGDFPTDEAADQAVLVWLELLAEQNPGKPPPEELAEAE